MQVTFRLVDNFYFMRDFCIAVEEIFHYVFEHWYLLYFEAQLDTSVMDKNGEFNRIKLFRICFIFSTKTELLEIPLSQSIFNAGNELCLRDSQTLAASHCRQTNCRKLEAHFRKAVSRIFVFSKF